MSKTRISRYEAFSAVKRYITRPDETFTSADIGASGLTRKALCEHGYLTLIGKDGRRKVYKINPNCRWLKGGDIT